MNANINTQKKKTGRHLLTHTSGLAYDHISPSLARYQQSLGHRLGHGKSVQQKYSYPLLYEPGHGFSYGAGIDWAGLMVSRASNTSLSEYMHTYIWSPLGTNDMTFHLDRREDLRARLVAMYVRDAATGKAVKMEGKAWDDPIGEAFGGAGAYASMPAYFKLLSSLLHDDGKLLSKESVATMFRPQLGGRSQQALMQLMQDPEINDMMAGGLPLGVSKNWGLAGVLLMEDSKDGRKAGTMSWGGLPNLVWVSLSAQLPFYSSVMPVAWFLGFEVKDVWLMYIFIHLPRSGSIPKPVSVVSTARRSSPSATCVR